MRFLRTRSGLGAAALMSLAACSEPFDLDMRSVGNGFDTTGAAQQPIAERPRPDNRGVISYPNYQVAVAFRGDTIQDVAGRVGLPAPELASYNGIPERVTLREGEIVALPRRVAEPSPATGAIGTGPILPTVGVDVAAIAGPAIDRSSDPGTGASVVRPPQGQTGAEPVRHRVQRGETAFSIARLYNVSVRSLADWNGLGPEFTVREGQFLLIPVATATEVAAAPPASAPGEGSVSPLPPSAAAPLPPAAPARQETPAPASPNLAADRTAASDSSRLLMPVSGSIIRPFKKGQNDGIGIAADAGTSVRAANAGTVAAITRDTDQVPILVLRHEGNLLTVYAGVDSIGVEKGDKVERGQAIAKVRSGSPSFLHFEVREGFDSVDPMPYLQ